MLPTFVIGLREGLEAALIVGIIAAFLRQQGRKDLLRWVFVGVGAAATLCLAIGITLNVVSKDLPQRQQEGMETVIGVLAVGMVTYMVVWMRRNSRGLKGQLEGLAADALGQPGAGGMSRAGRAMVLMAFLAVLREGIETVVFLLAVFDTSHSGASGPIGVTLGLALAIILGYGIYRGGVRLNLSKFFRATGLVLVLVAAGLVVNALHTAHEAGWLDVGQGPTIDLTWLVRPGSVQSSLLTGMLGVQPKPVVIETIGWLIYLVPVGLFVAWPPGRGLGRRTVARSLAVGGAVLALGAVVFGLTAPSHPSAPTVTSAGGGATASVLTMDGSHAVVRTSDRATQGTPVRDLSATRTSSAIVHNVAATVYVRTAPGNASASRPTRISYAAAAALNGGRLPIGTHQTPGGLATVSYADTATLTVWAEPRTHRILEVASTEKVTASLVEPGGVVLPLSGSVASTTVATSAGSVREAAAKARADIATLDRRAVLTDLAWTAGLAALVALLAAGIVARTARRRVPEALVTRSTPEATLVRS